MKKLGIICFAGLLSACSQFTPFEDMRREAGQIPTIGQSSDDKAAICYNPLWHDDQQLFKLATEACARTNRKPVYYDTNYFSCRLINPATAFYKCE